MPAVGVRLMKCGQVDDAIRRLDGKGTGGFKNAKGTVTFGHGGTTTPNTFTVTVPGTPIALHGGGVA